MHAPATIDSYLAGDLIGFSAGLVITGLLLAFTLRARRLPGTPIANILLACCALIWNASGLARAILLAFGWDHESVACLLLIAIQISGVSVWPIPVLAIWRDYAVSPWQRTLARLMLGLAVVDGIVLTLGLWAAALGVGALLPFYTWKEAAAYNSALLAVGASASLLSRPASRGVKLSALMVLTSVTGAMLALIVLHNVPLSPLQQTKLRSFAQQAPLLMLFASFFMFARFRFADVFIRRSLSILLAAVLATTLVSLWQLEAFAPGAAATFPRSLRLFGMSALATALLLGFASLDRYLGALVNRSIVRTPDYQEEARRLRARLQELHDDDEVVAAVCEAVGRTLDVGTVQVIDSGRLPRALWPIGLHEGEVVELDRASPVRQLLAGTTKRRGQRRCVAGDTADAAAPAEPMDMDVELLAPVRVAGDVVSVLAVPPAEDDRSFLTREVEYLRGAAAQAGARLDALRAERELVERQNREALLHQQLSEAELRALRAQINPHFLFNALNTIADLIVTGPAAAEAMTLRLAKVFRHVLAHSARPFSSIESEIDFLRSYLGIEEARFGPRLLVHIDVRPDVAAELIPTLLLQPLVENALKHGLAPKPGPGTLWIAARERGGQVCVTVEDDGLGIGAGGRRGAGVGLTNVAQRLSVAYQDRASLTLDPRDGGGTRVTILLPRDRRQTPAPAESEKAIAR
jgi:two-component system LytT family sensor kinase